MKTEVCIIGAGVAGCFIAIQCIDNNIPFIIIDKEKKPNSKINTCFINHDYFECGASVFLDKQIEIFKLLKRYNLQEKCISISGGGSIMKYKDLTTEETKMRFQSIKKQILSLINTNINDAKELTLKEFCKLNLSIEDYKLLKNCWMDWYEICDSNAHDIVKQMEYEKGSNYFILKGGLTQLIQSCVKEFGPNRCLFNVLCKEIIVDDTKQKSTLIKCVDQYSNLTWIHANKLIISTSLEHLPNILSNNITFNTIKSRLLKLYETVPTLRYFIVMKEPISEPKLEHEIVKKYTIGGKCQWILKMDSTCYMIYVDGDLANHIQSYDDQTICKTFCDWMNEVYMLNYFRMDNIKSTKRAYWKHAFTIHSPIYYKEKQNSLDEQLTTFNSNLPFMFTCIPKRYQEGWMNAHLYNL